MKFSSFSILVIFAVLFSLLLGFSIAPSKSVVKFKVPAIGDNGKGELVDFLLEFKPGTGRTMVDIDNALFSQDVEHSLRKARFNAEKFLGAKLIFQDVVARVEGLREVDGESAGVLLTAAIVAGMSNKNLNELVAISAMIDENGNAMPVGGIEEKLFAAIENGRKVFLVADGQHIKFEDEFSKKIKIVRIENAEEAVKLIVV